MQGNQDEQTVKKVHKKFTRLAEQTSGEPAQRDPVLLEGQQFPIDLLGPLESFKIDTDIDEGIEVSDRATIANFGSLNAEFLGLRVDAFTPSALGVDDLVERTVAI